MKLSYPVIGNYEFIAYYFFKNVLNVEIVRPTQITNKTIELGNKYSPDFICTPFKYTLGTMIENCENGVDVMLQLGGGCRYGYYAELQEKILKELGYNITIYNLIAGDIEFKRIVKILKKLNKKLSIIKVVYYFYMTYLMIKYMNKVDSYIRSNMGFEIEKNSFLNIKEKLENEFLKINNPIKLYWIYKKYLKKIMQVKINKPEAPLKVGIIGELYTLMEPHANYDMEKILASYKIDITRFTDVSYLLFNKKKVLKKSLKYSKYLLEADASSNIYWTNYMIKNNYDGIIHIKSSFCTPEIADIPVITKMCNENNMPIISMSFDVNTSEVGLKTRLESFYDMLEMRRK